MATNTNLSFRFVALASAPSAMEWLRSVSAARVLHVFDRSCNLLANDGSILSLVTPEVGPGPNTMVVTPIDDSLQELIKFVELLCTESPVSIHSDRLQVGSLAVDTTQASYWRPTPNWEGLSVSGIPLEVASLDALALPMAIEDKPSIMADGQWVSNFCQAIIRGWSMVCTGLLKTEMALCLEGARRLAGLGPGLTPAGDDFLVGVLYALWASWPKLEVGPMASAIASVAGSRTTRLSASWLSAASRGEAGLPWHHLVESMVERDGSAVGEAMERIIMIGHTSGSYALSGFLLALNCLTISEQRSIDMD